MAGKTKVNKTKTGHEYRVRGPKGKIRGEYEAKSKAKKKAKKVAKKNKK
jgi:hypothetical protein